MHCSAVAAFAYVRTHSAGGSLDMSTARPVIVIIIGAGASYACARFDDDNRLVAPTTQLPQHAFGKGVWATEPGPWSEVRPPLTQELIAGNRFLNGILARHAQAQPV